MAKIGLLSGSTNGQPILITATATPGTTIHTAVTGTTQLDVPKLYVMNTHTAAVVVTVEFGNATTTTNTTVTIPADSGKFLIEEDGGLNGGKVVRAFAATANVISCTGKVLRSDAAETF